MEDCVEDWMDGLPPATRNEGMTLKGKPETG